MPRLLITIANILAVLLLGVFFLSPKYQNYKELDQEIKNLNTELRFKEENLANFSKISSELTQYKAALDKIDSALPQNPSLPSLFWLLETKASQWGLLLKDIKLESIREMTKGARVKAVLVSLSLSGSYQGIKDFLSSLERNSRLIEAEKLSFSAPEEARLTAPGPQEFKPFEFKLTIRTHSY